MREMVVDASGRRKYVCLRCGNVYWSRAKKPQCNVCRSKRAMDYEEFLKLPKEEQDRILGRRSEAKSDEIEEKKDENEVKGVLNPVDGKRYRLKTEEELREMKEKYEREAVEDGEEEVEEKPKLVKKSESPKVKSGEKAKGEKVKRGIPIPKPKFGLGLKALAVGMAFVYILYKLGYFESVINHLRTLGAFKDLNSENEEKSEVKVESSVLERVKKNLSG